MYVIGLVFLLMTNAAQLLIPQATRWALDAYDEVFGALVLLGISALFVALGRIGWRLFIVGASRRIERDLRQNLFDHFTRLDQGFYSKNSVGDLMARATNDLEAVRMSIGMSVITFVDGTFMGVGIIAILLVSNLTLGFLTILPLFIVTGIILLLGGMVGKLFEALQKGYSALSRDAQESLSGLRLIQSFAREEYFSERFYKTGIDYLKKNLRLTRVWGLFFPLIGLLSGITTWMLLWFGGGMIVRGEISPGLFAAYLGYLGMLVWPMISVGMTVNMLQRGAASLRRIITILETQPDIVSSVNAKAPQDSAWPLEVKNLSFQYPDAEKPVLTKVSFTLNKGEVIGILGETGSGKTTLLRLLARLLDPPDKTIFLGGKDIKEWPLNELRSRFSLVPQQPFLFSETLWTNMIFAYPQATDELVLEMAESSGLSKDLGAFPQGWKTLVGERGVTLSGGQKQRTALARALIAPGDILELDDALSAVDNQTEERILKSLLSTGKRTILMVSHRISTLLRCQRVLVLDNGSLVEEGPPRDLLQTGGIFSEIAALQHIQLEEIL